MIIRQGTTQSGREDLYLLGAFVGNVTGATVKNKLGEVAIPVWLQARKANAQAWLQMIDESDYAILHSEFKVKMQAFKATKA